MQRALLVILLICTLLSACTQRMICPAYQSAFIYDKDQLRKKFSYFQEDSTPKILTASRNKYLIAESQPYKKRIRSMQTVPMTPVYVIVPDSLKPEDQRELLEEGEDGVIPGAELDLAARSVIDSTFIVDVPKAEEAPLEDSVYMISRDKEVRFLKYNMPDSLVYEASTGKYVPQKPSYTVVNITFNVEQDNYMWYLRDYLVLPDVRVARNQQANRDSESAEAKKSKKGIKGFFKNIFGKKKKEEEAPVEEAPKPVNENEDFDYIDENAEAQPQTGPAQENVKEKRGLFSRKKKDKKPKKEKQQAEPAKEKESPPPPTDDTTPPLEDDEEIDSF